MLQDNKKMGMLSMLLLIIYLLLMLLGNMLKMYQDQEVPLLQQVMQKYKLKNNHKLQQIIQIMDRTNIINGKIMEMDMLMTKDILILMNIIDLYYSLSFYYIYIGICI